MPLALSILLFIMKNLFIGENLSLLWICSHCEVKKARLAEF